MLETPVWIAGNGVEFMRMAEPDRHPFLRSWSLFYRAVRPLIRGLMNDPVTKLNLWVISLGLISMMFALQYRRSGERFRWGFEWGFAKTLTVGGRILFFAGLIFLVIGALL